MEQAEFAWLKCKVIEKSIQDCIVEVEILDGTPIQIKVSPTLLDDENYLKVERVGKNSENKLVYVRLPQPSIQYGHFVTVKQSHVKN